MNVSIGDCVVTNDGHRGVVTKIYKVTGVSTMYVHIQESDSRLWYCPITTIVRKEV